MNILRKKELTPGLIENLVQGLVGWPNFREVFPGTTFLWSPSWNLFLCGQVAFSVVSHGRRDRCDPKLLVWPRPQLPLGLSRKYLLRRRSSRRRDKDSQVKISRRFTHRRALQASARDQHLDCRKWSFEDRNRGHRGSVWVRTQTVGLTSFFFCLGRGLLVEVDSPALGQPRRESRRSGQAHGNRLDELFPVRGLRQPHCERQHQHRGQEGGHAAARFCLHLMPVDRALEWTSRHILILERS